MRVTFYKVEQKLISYTISELPNNDQETKGWMEFNHTHESSKLSNINHQKKNDNIEELVIRQEDYDFCRKDASPRNQR